ncbi:hypothetical protein I3760_03G269500 [Carya illinoinensis]|nr:hypothetical protein I3760_03G269500 [Carya illinoinensis]
MNFLPFDLHQPTTFSVDSFTIFKFPPFPFLKSPGFCLSTTASMASFKSSISMNNSCDLHGRTSGEVHVIVGPMFTGKTTALLHWIRFEGSTSRNIAIIKSRKDARYAIDSVVTHDRMKFPCWALPDLLSFR